MFKTMPGPLQRQLIKMTLTAIAIDIVGFAAGLAMNDHVTIWLTCVLLIAYAFRIAVMLKEMLDEQYDIVEGTILSVTDVPLQRQQKETTNSNKSSRLFSGYFYLKGNMLRYPSSA